jgi:hypothetical protein
MAAGVPIIMIVHIKVRLRGTGFAGHQWLMPVILATQEVAIRRIVVPSHPWANSSQDSVSKIPNTEQGWWSGSSERVPNCKCEALSLNPSTTKKKRKKRECNLPSSLTHNIEETPKKKKCSRSYSLEHNGIYT